MPKVELNLEDDELKELLLGDRDKAMQSIYGQDPDAKFLSPKRLSRLKLRLMNVRMSEPIHGMVIGFVSLPTRVGTLELRS